MPTITFRGKEIQCAQGENLRRVLLNAGLGPYNGQARWLNCRGFGTCGTCALRIEGPVHPPEPQGKERVRLGLPPHRRDAGLRLSCQVRVEGDLRVEKCAGFWGERVGEAGETSSEG